MRCGSTEDARPKTRGDRKQERPSDWKLPAPSPILGTRTPKFPGYPQRCSLVGPGSLSLARPTGSTPRVFVANADLSFALLASSHVYAPQGSSRSCLAGRRCLLSLLGLRSRAVGFLLYRPR